MQFKAIMLFVTVTVLSVLIIFTSAAKSVMTEFSTKSQNTVFKEVDVLPSIEKIGGDEEQKSDNSVENSGAVDVATNSTAKGKIVEKFLSPYTAGTAFNNVYLKNSSGADINLPELLSSPLGFKIKNDNSVQVLIVHTHATESYMLEDRDYYTEDDQTRSTDNSYNMIAVGNVIEEKLSSAGIGVIHDTTQHDYPSYSGSYSRAKKTIESDMAAYPSIKIVIDIHRDSISSGEDKIKPVVNINGENAAQVMLVMGSQTGNITDFPNWMENLKLAVKYQQSMEVMYKGLARSIALNSAKYNENLCVGSILLEVGTEANTLEEAKRAAEYAGNALVALLNTLK